MELRHLLPDLVALVLVEEGERERLGGEIAPADERLVVVLD